MINHQKISVKEVSGTLVTIAGVAMFFLLQVRIYCISLQPCYCPRKLQFI